MRQQTYPPGTPILRINNFSGQDTIAARRTSPLTIELPLPPTIRSTGLWMSRRAGGYRDQLERITRLMLTWEYHLHQFAVEWSRSLRNISAHQRPWNELERWLTWLTLLAKLSRL